MKVNIDFDLLYQNAQDFLQYRKEFEVIQSSLMNTRKLINDNWKSYNASIFDTKFNEFLIKIQKNIDNMTRYANTILKINEDFNEMDLKYNKMLKIENDKVTGEKYE